MVGPGNSQQGQWRRTWAGKNWVREQTPSQGVWVWARLRTGREWGYNLGKEKQIPPYRVGASILAGEQTEKGGVSDWKP